MAAPSRFKRIAAGWVFLNVMTAGLAPALLFMDPGRVRWFWEFTPILLGITAHDVALAALGGYAWLMLWLWIVATDCP